MLYAAIDIHKRVFQAAVLNVETGETVERRFGATREELNDWAMPLQGKLAVVCNAGPLVQPLTRQQYQSGAPAPYQLFSHSDQVAQWQTSRSDTRSSTGWGGRMQTSQPAFASSRRSRRGRFQSA